jgi:hypothetical protein
VTPPPLLPPAPAPLRRVSALTHLGPREPSGSHWEFLSVAGDNSSRGRDRSSQSRTRCRPDCTTQWRHQRPAPRSATSGRGWVIVSGRGLNAEMYGLGAEAIEVRVFVALANAGNPEALVERPFRGKVPNVQDGGQSQEEVSPVFVHRSSLLTTRDSIKRGGRCSGLAGGTSGQALPSPREGSRRGG